MTGADTVPALSVRQPWADLIRSGVKTLEVRTWTTAYRGPLVICASAAGSAGVRGGVRALVQLAEILRADVFSDAWTEASWLAAEAAAGCLIDHHTYLWRLEDVRPLEFVSLKGRLGLFRVDARLVVPA